MLFLVSDSAEDRRSARVKWVYRIFLVSRKKVHELYTLYDLAYNP